MALNRPAPTPDAAIALACAALAARAAFHSALLQFYAAGSARAPKDLALGAVQLVDQVLALKAALAGRLEAKGALDEDAMTRLEDIEAQGRVQEEQGEGGGADGGALTVKLAAEGARIAAKATSLAARAVGRVGRLSRLPAALLTQLQAGAEQLLSQAELLKSMARNNAQLDVSTAMVSLEGARSAYQGVEQLRAHLRRVGPEGSSCGPRSSRRGSSWPTAPPSWQLTWQASPPASSTPPKTNPLPPPPLARQSPSHSHSHRHSHRGRGRPH